MAQTEAGDAASENDRNVIIVTARKKEESIQEVPASITAFSADDLSEKGINDLESAADYTPGFIFEDFADNFNAAPNIRGLTQTDITQPQQNVASFIDGIYLTRNFAFDVGSADLERLEIVKGPQSALYGRNAFGGAINYVFREPTEELSADAELTVGNFGKVTAKLGVGAYLVPDVLGIRIWGSGDRFSGSWRNGFPGATGRDARAGGYKNTGYGGTLIFKPFDRLTLEGKYLKLDREAETSASYVVQATRNQVQLNCGPNATPGVFRSPAPLGPLFICGDLTPNPLDFASALSTRPADPVILQPQQGTIANTELISAKAAFEVTDGLNISYQYGRFEADGDAQREVVYNAIDPSPIFPFGQIRPLSFQNGTTKSDSHEVRLAYDNWGGSFCFRRLLSF